MPAEFRGIVKRAEQNIPQRDVGIIQMFAARLVMDAMHFWPLKEIPLETRYGGVEMHEQLRGDGHTGIDDRSIPIEPNTKKASTALNSEFVPASTGCL